MLQSADPMEIRPDLGEVTLVATGARTVRRVGLGQIESHRALKISFDNRRARQFAVHRGAEAL
jgi:hypothetical protein